MPKISVIIPVYNVEKYLARCLDSVIAQTFSDIEIVCINDGSTDNSADILSEYATRDSRIRIVSQENAGLSIARNVGLEHISGQYVCFIDSDDWVDENYLEVLFNLLSNSGADIAMAGMKFVKGDCISCNNTPNMIASDLAIKLNNFPNGSVCDKLFKTELFTKNTILFPCGRYYEDNLVLLKLAVLSKTVVFTNSVSYYYVMNPSGICHSVSPQRHKKRQEDKLYIAEQMARYAKDNKIKGRHLFAVRQFIVRTIAQEFLSKKSKYYTQIKHILGKKFVGQRKLAKLVHNIKRFVWRTDIDSSGAKTYKVFKISVYKTVGM
jgi:glycosyltransferase involved in cell wall biosynthesis